MIRIRIEVDEKEVGTVAITDHNCGERMVMLTRDNTGVPIKPESRGIVLCFDEDPWLVARRALNSIVKERQTLGANK